MRLSRTALLCFLAVYVIWGSTYLAILIGIDTIPPWTMSAARFFIASFLMALLALRKREAKLENSEKKLAILSGLCLIFANAIVGLVEQWVPSGIAAVVIGAMPIWIMLIGWSFFGEAKPTPRKISGALIGLLGIALIATQNGESAGAHRLLLGTCTLFVSSCFWATGTLLQRRGPPIKSLFRYSALQMFAGAVGVGIVSLIAEKPWTLPASQISAASLGALAYLIVFGSIIAFTAYAWLSRNVEPHLVSTYALVNPLIAVALGWAIKAEPVNLRFLFATVLVLIGLTLLTRAKRTLRPS